MSNPPILPDAAFIAPVALAFDDGTSHGQDVSASAPLPTTQVNGQTQVLALTSGVPVKIDARLAASIKIQVNGLNTADTLAINGSQNNDSNTFLPYFEGVDPAASAGPAIAVLTTGTLKNGRWSADAAAVFSLTWTTTGGNAAPTVSVILGN